MMKLRLSYLEHVMRGQDYLGNTITLGEVEGSRKRKAKYEMDGFPKRIQRLEFC